MGSWWLDVIEQMVLAPEPDGRPSEKSRAAIKRIHQAGNEGGTFDLTIGLTVSLLIELAFQAATPSGVEVEEKLRRSFNSTRSAARGDGPTNPFLPCDQT